MRIALPVSLLTLCVAAPAAATAGLRCAPVTGSGPVLNLTIGHGAGPTIVGASLAEGKARRSTMGNPPSLAIAQSWIDSQLLWLDLTDANATRYEARLRARFSVRLRGRPATGTMVHNGRIYSVRCIDA